MSSGTKYHEVNKISSTAVRVTLNVLGKYFRDNLIVVYIYEAHTYDKEGEKIKWLASIGVDQFQKKKYQLLGSIPRPANQIIFIQSAKCGQFEGFKKDDVTKLINFLIGADI